MNLPKVLFLVEGNTDIRFVTGLSQICSLTMAVPTAIHQQSDLKQRIASSGADVVVEEVPGGRGRFQAASFAYLLRRAKEFDLILCQEVLRGSLSGTLVGLLKAVPVITYMNIAPVEYFHCRYERKQCGWLKAVIGETVIRALMTINGRLANRCVAVGPYLMAIAAGYCPRTTKGLAYGVDTGYYCPVTQSEKLELRTMLNLPPDRFIVFLSSRISHEKDPETVLRAVAIARSQNLDAVLLNLGGGYRDLFRLAKQLVGPEASGWVLARPAAHPMTELAAYYQASDCLAQASLAEGLGMSPLEAMSCGTPAVCTAVGGLAANLNGYSRLTPRRDPEAMARELLWISKNRESARAQALAGREFVIREWSREKAFRELRNLFEAVRGVPATGPESV